MDTGYVTWTWLWTVGFNKKFMKSPEENQAVAETEPQGFVHV